MCDAGMSLPMPLHEYLSGRVYISFVYDREWGAFPVDGGRHYQAMAQLLAMHEGLDRFEIVNINSAYQASERYLREYAGSGFVSSVAARRFITYDRVLTAGERAALRRFEIFYMIDESVDGRL